MRIYDEENSRTLKSVLIMLTPSELHELSGGLRCLSEKNDHIHVNDAEYKREITIGLYTPNNMYSWAPDVIKLLQEDD